MTTSAIFLLILSPLTVTNGWVLNVNKMAVTSHLTENVTMICNNGDNTVKNNNGILSVYRIRLSKFTKDNIWKSVAVLARHESSVKTSLTDASVSGRLDTIANTFLKVVFKVATDQSIGQFLCEVDGFDIYEDIKAAKTSPVLVKEEMASYDELLKTVLVMKKKEKNEVKDVKDEIETIKRNMDDMYQTIANISATQQQIIKRIEGLTNGQMLTAIENMLEKKTVQIQRNISDRIEANRIGMNNAISEVIDKQSTAINERNKLSIAIANITEQQHVMLSEINQKSTTIANLTEQQQIILSDKNQITTAIANLTGQQQAILSERNLILSAITNLTEQQQAMSSERDQILSAITNLTEQQQTMLSERDLILLAIANLTEQQQAMLSERNLISTVIANLTEHRKVILSERNQNSTVINDLKKQQQAFLSERNQIAAAIVNLTEHQQVMFSERTQILTAIANLKEHQRAMLYELNQKSTAIANITEYQQIILSERNQIAVAIANLTEHQQAILSERNQILTSITNLTATQNKITSKLNKMPFNVNNFTCTPESLIDNKMDMLNTSWPEGDYLLPAPDTGCPNTLNTTWQGSYIRISTGPVSKNKDETSRDLNLLGDVMQVYRDNSYLLLKSCRMVSGGLGLEWPAGSYCIQGYKYNHHGDDEMYCPSKFHYGYIRYGRYYDGAWDVVVNMDVVRFSYDTYIPYCCRQDGSVNNPIMLPTHSPFYLYRFGGKCQHVVGMTVTRQWIHLGTGRWGRGNYYYNDGNDKIYHPDGWADHSTTDDSNNGVMIEMCYYKPRD